MEKENKVIKGYKGFDKDLKCRGFQYEIGKEYEQEGEIKCCNKGFHFCENPFNVFGYYSPNNSRYCEVEGSGKYDKGNSDSKVSVSKLKVGIEIGLKGIIESGLKFIFDKVKWTKESSATGNYSGASATGYKSGASATGDYSGASATGDCSGASATGDCSGASATGNCSGASATGNCSGASATGNYSGASATGYKSGASATGDYSGASATGDCSGASATGDCSGASATGNCSGASATGNYSGASATGDYSGASATGNCSGASATGYKSGASAGKGSIALATGMLAKAKGKIGAWIVVSECRKINNNYFIKEVKCAFVDGESIKEDVYYILKNGEFKESKEQ